MFFYTFPWTLICLGALWEQVSSFLRNSEISVFGEIGFVLGLTGLQDCVFLVDLFERFRMVSSKVDVDFSRADYGLRNYNVFLANQSAAKNKNLEKSRLSCDF